MSLARGSLLSLDAFHFNILHVRFPLESPSARSVIQNVQDKPCCFEDFSELIWILEHVFKQEAHPHFTIREATEFCDGMSCESGDEIDELLKSST